MIFLFKQWVLSILTKPMFMLFRYMLSFHSRLAITNNVLDYYDIGISPSELKSETEYEDRLVAQMKKSTTYFKD